MTSRIKAINALRPKITLEHTVQQEELFEFIAGRTGLNAGTMIQVLTELHEAIVYFNSLGTYLPNLRLDGSFDLEHRQDPTLKRDLKRRNFNGAIRNRANSGKSADELVALWNQTHPDDPVDQ